MRSGSTGRLRNAICTERSSLSRSKGTRRPLRLITTSSRNCTRSNVVKRKLQARHTRRRRITEESSVGRESLTCVSRLPQLGQRMGCSSQGVRSLAVVSRHARSVRRAIKAFLAAALGPRSHSSRPRSDDTSSVVNRKSADERPHLLAHSGLGDRILFHALAREGVEHLHDQLTHLLELGNTEAPAR